MTSDGSGLVANSAWPVRLLDTSKLMERQREPFTLGPDIKFFASPAAKESGV
jgi:hypothetical protein